MDIGIYVAMSRELGIMRDMEVTSNNLANVTTTGYDGDDLLFKDYMVPNTTQEGQVAYSNDIATYRDTSEGTLQTTNAPLDVAIHGQGYFVVQTPLGMRYTRNGNFKVSPGGQLVSPDGYLVMDEENQPISFDQADRVILIHDDGTINVDNTDRAKIKVVQFDNPQLLERVGNTMYKSDATPKAADDFAVVSGMLESSNIKPVEALTHMLYVARSISDVSNFMSTIDTLSRKASDTLAKVYS